jgi:mRNA-degrading endonuclease RelE of RelBE toxin-antitoxin system
MSWACNLSRQAAKQLRSLPRDRLGQVARAIDEIGEDPTLGDVRPVKSGRFKGALRKRVGPYRIVYSIEPDAREVNIAAILTRGDTTYH